MRHLLPQISHRLSLRHLSALSSLASHRLIQFAGASIVGMFLPIFIYEFFGLALVPFVIWYIVAYAVRIPLLILAAKHFDKIGLTVSMAIATVVLCLFYGTTFILEVVPGWQPMLFLTIGIVLQGIFSAMYWTPFHVDFTRFSTKGNRGKQVSILYAAKDAVAVVGPMVGGWLILTFTYGAIFGAAILVILTSLIPLLFVPKIKAKYEYGFFESFKKLFSKKYRYMTLSMMAHGAESVVSFIIWPIFLFTLFEGEYLDVGIFASIIVVVSIGLRLFVGKWLDHHKRKKLLKLGVDLYAFGWLLKAIVTSVGGVFAASTFHSFGSIMMKTPLDVMTYEKAADAGHYIDEFTTLREISLCIGRVIILALLIPIMLHFSISSAFIVAAVVSVAITLFAKFTMKEHLPSLN